MEIVEILNDILFYVGIVSFSAAGAMVAIDKETDLFGVVFLSIITCFGGGMIRDTMLSDELPAFFSLPVAIIVSAITACIVFLIARFFKHKYVMEEEAVKKINNILDALGLGLFVSVGTEAYITQGALVAIIAGMLSGVGGSLIRDVILNDIPFILRKRVYACAAIVGAALHYVIAHFSPFGEELSGFIATVACVFAVFTIRMCATVFKWNFPKAIIFSEFDDK